MMHKFPVLGLPVVYPEGPAMSPGFDVTLARECDEERTINGNGTKWRLKNGRPQTG